MNNRSILSGAALAEIPRILSLLDRRPISKTAGCGDRVHWQWKFTDFPGARFQEAAWTLALIYSKDLPGNSYFGHKRILEWLERTLEFWISIQHSDGSFDEAYPFEKSFVATGFSSLAISEAITLAPVSPRIREATIAALARAGDFLIRTDETHAFISNHRSGAAAALLRIGRLTGSQACIARANELIASVIDHQNDEGWYLEYTGADPGYQTQGTFYLALCYAESRDQSLLDSLKKACAFHEHFFYPDGTVGVEIGSRNTEFIFPGGFEILAPEIQEAGLIADRIALAIQARKAPGPYSMDSYNILPITNSFLVGAAAAVERAGKVYLPNENRYFAETGLSVIRNQKYHAVTNTRKGGAFRIVSVDGVVSREEPGFALELGDGRIATSQSSGQASVTLDRIEVTVPFTFAATTTLTPWLLIGFRIFSLTLGRIPFLARMLKSRLVKKLTVPGEAIAVHLHRVITFGENQVTIRDEVSASADIAIKRIARGGPICSIHMGSSQYFEPRSLDDEREFYEKAEAAVTALPILSERTIRIP